jgi:hypothetical protein
MASWHDLQAAGKAPYHFGDFGASTGPEDLIAEINVNVIGAKGRGSPHLNKSGAEAPFQQLENPK